MLSIQTTYLHVNMYVLLFLRQVSINGTVMVFGGSADLQFIGNVTGLSLMNGVTYTVSVVARNSVGDSETFTSSYRVPCEWNG